MRKFLLLSLTVFSLGLSGCIEFEVTGTDVTAEFEETFGRMAVVRGVADADLAMELAGHTVFTVSGFLSKAKKPDETIEEFMKRDQTFDELHRWFDSNGVKYQKARINPKGDVANNGRYIARQLEAIKGPVLLITHSKGGLDSLESLIRRPDLVDKIKGWVAFQSPFFGSPIADYVTTLEASNIFFKLLIKMFGGDPNAVVALTTETRMVYMDEWEEEIAHAVTSIPSIAFTSYMDKQPKGQPDTSLKFTRNLMLQFDIANDGIVPWKSAVLRGSNYISVPGWDHFNTVKEQPLPGDRILLYRTLLTMLSRRI